MPVRTLTVSGYQKALNRMIVLADSVHKDIPFHPAGLAYTSILVSFLMHQTVAAKSLISLRISFGNNWFPVTVGYAIARTMFEVDVNAHYVAQQPQSRSLQYINFEHVLRKRQMDAYDKHRKSPNTSWRDSMTLAWQEFSGTKQSKINNEFQAIRHLFETVNSKGKVSPYQNWSGKKLRDMAVAVNHEEAYDILYSEMSSYTHADVELANRYLRVDSDGPYWTQASEEFGVGAVFRAATTFMSCFLELFSTEFEVWNQNAIEECWKTGSEN